MPVNLTNVVTYFFPRSEVQVKLLIEFGMVVVCFCLCNFFHELQKLLYYLLNLGLLQGYPCCLMFCHITAQSITFLFEEKKGVLFSRYLDFLVLGESTNFICDAVVDTLVVTFICFFKILGSIKIKFGQLLVELMTDNLKLVFSFVVTTENYEIMRSANF